MPITQRTAKLEPSIGGAQILEGPVELALQGQRLPVGEI